MGGRKRSQRKKGEYFPFFHPTTKYFYSERKKGKNNTKPLLVYRGVF
jgi:hypothetical protein